MIESLLRYVLLEHSSSIPRKSPHDTRAQPKYLSSTATHNMASHRHPPPRIIHSTHSTSSLLSPLLFPPPLYIPIIPLSLFSSLHFPHSISYVLLPEGNRRRPSKRRSMIAPRRRRARVAWRRAGRLREGLSSLLRPFIPPPIEPRLVRVLARRLTRLPR